MRYTRVKKSQIQTQEPPKKASTKDTKSHKYATHVPKNTSPYSTSRTKSKLVNIFLIIFVIIFIITAYKIGQWAYSNIKEGKEHEKLIDEVIKQSDDENVKIDVDFAKLKETNPDVVAWIRIESLGIDYPVLQTTDNEYYLKKDLNKEDSTCGSIFMDYQNNKNFTDNNTVIFGHNLTTGKMFAPLYDAIKDGTQPGQIEITIITEQRKMKYQVFSSYTEKPNVQSIIPGLNELKSYENFINTVKQKTTTTYDIEPRSDKKMITLSTCDTSGRKRAVFHAICIYEALVAAPIPEAPVETPTPEAQSESSNNNTSDEDEDVNTNTTSVYDENEDEQYYSDDEDEDSTTADYLY